MKIERPLLRGRLVRRYKRFLADVKLEDGRLETVHCPNPGSMRGLDRPGIPVLVSDSEDPKRKLRLTLERVKPGSAWVGVNTFLPNRIAREAIEAGRIPELRGYPSVRSEVKLGERSRIDLRLESPMEPPCWVEVKSVTLREGRRARFPDSVTERGRKHLVELRSAVTGGTARAAMLFVVNRRDCDVFEAAGDIDPAYAEELRVAAAAGVEMLAYQVRFRGASVCLAERVPIRI